MNHNDTLRDSKARQEGMNLLQYLEKQEENKQRRAAHKLLEQPRSLLGAISLEHRVFWCVTHARKDRRTGAVNRAAWSDYAEELYRRAVPWKKHPNGCS